MANFTDLYGIYCNNISATNLLKMRKYLCSFLFYISAWTRLTIVFKSYLFSHVFWLDVRARDMCWFPFYLHVDIGAMLLILKLTRVSLKLMKQYGLFQLCICNRLKTRFLRQVYLFRTVWEMFHKTIYRLLTAHI